MENRAHALMAGIFTVVLAAALIIVAMWLTGRTSAKDPYILVTPSSISGLNEKAEVRFRGVQVGRVDKIRFEGPANKDILIRIGINPDIRVTRGTFAQLKYKGITGLAYVELNDSHANPTPLETSEKNPARIPVRPSLLDEVGNSAPQLLARINELTERLNRTLGDQNQKKFSNILTNIDNATGQFVALQKELEPTIKALPRLANKATDTFDKADSFFGTAKNVASQVEKKLPAIDRISNSFESLGRSGAAVGDEILTSTLPHLNDLIDDLTTTSRNLNRATTELSDRPQSLVFGKLPPTPGPGEAGYVPPK